MAFRVRRGGTLYILAAPRAATREMRAALLALVVRLALTERDDGRNAAQRDAGAQNFMAPIRRARSRACSARAETARVVSSIARTASREMALIRATF